QAAQSPAFAESQAHPASVPPSRIVPLPQRAATLLWIAYAIFVLARLGGILRAWLRTVHLRRSARILPAPAAVEPVWARCLDRFGLTGVKLLWSADIDSPVTAGAWRQVVILPDTLLTETSGHVLTAAIGHEMAHSARRDFALTLVYEALYAPISFHPAAWILSRGVERTREIACDELVTRKLIDPGAYAQAIVGIAATMTALRRPGYTLGVFDGDILEE